MGPNDTQTGSMGNGNVTTWYGTGADPELVGYMQNRGWHEGKPEDIALAAIKAHREASVKIGLPPEQVLRLPKDANDTAGWAGVYTRLGKPADAKEYDFAGLKYADGTEVEPALVDVIRANAFAANITKDGAKTFAAGLVKHFDVQRTEAAAAAGAALETERRALKTNWGPNFDANMVVARQAAAALGFTAEDVQAMESRKGYAHVMDQFRKVGAAIKEDSFIQSGNQGLNNGIMTREQALTRRAELKKDEAWVKKVMAGDTAANRELMTLNTIIEGDDTDDSRRASR